MVMLACIGLFFIVLSGIINAIELRKFFKALAILNQCTISFADKMAYPFRFLSICRFLGPLIPDVTLMSAAGAIGLGGGVLGSIIAIGGTCMVTLTIKIALRCAKKGTSGCRNFSVEMSRI